MEKRIKDYEDYAITDDGKVISYKYNKPRIMKTYYQKNGYENVGLCKNNVVQKFRVHRLVAETYIPNPNSYPEVNHIDGNPKNNKVTNLEWVDHKTNLEKSKCGFLRNFIKCKLIRISTQEIIGEFNSIKEACRYASKEFAMSGTYLEKARHSGDYKLILESVETKSDNDNIIQEE